MTAHAAAAAPPGASPPHLYFQPPGKKLDRHVWDAHAGSVTVDAPLLLPRRQRRAMKTALARTTP